MRTSEIQRIRTKLTEAYEHKSAREIAAEAGLSVHWLWSFSAGRRAQTSASARLKASRVRTNANLAKLASYLSSASLSAPRRTSPND